MAETKKNTKKQNKVWKFKGKKKSTIGIDTGSKCGLIEYRMPKAMMEDLVKNRTPQEKKMDVQDFLCNYVNEQLGLLGYCVRVVYA